LLISICEDLDFKQFSHFLFSLVHSNTP
jgi:hypothetical protein